MMDWDDLRVFLAVVRSGSVRRAAGRIGTTHATVSRHIRSLEGALGGPLLQRVRNTQELTLLGTRILPMAEAVEENISAIDRFTFSEEKGLAGPIRLSIAETLYLSVLRSVIQDFAERFPMIELEISGTDRHTSLSRREADVVLRLTKTPPESAYGRKLSESPLAGYAAPSYLKDRPALDRWIALDYEPARHAPFPARQAALFDSPLLAAEYLAAGQGIGMLPCYMGDSDARLVRVPGMQPVPDLSLWALTHGDMRQNSRVRALMDHLYSNMETIRPLVSGKRPRPY